MSNATEELPDDLASALALLAQERARRVAAEAEAATAKIDALFDIEREIINNIDPQAWLAGVLARIAAGEEPRLAAKCEASQGPLGGVVRQANPAVSLGMTPICSPLIG